MTQAKQTTLHSSVELPPLLKTDTAEEKLSRDLLIFASALMFFVPMLWLMIYWTFGLRVSTTIPLIYQGLSATALGIYYKTRNFRLLAHFQLGLFLVTPFAMQLVIGNFVGGGGITLWALMAPVGALVFLGARESVPWFLAYVVLTALSGFFDFYVGDSGTSIPVRTAAVFLGVNFAAISAMLYFLIRHFVRENEQNRGILQAQHNLLRTEQDRSERLLLNILPGPIALRLKAEEKTIADGFADVTVMFADIVNFTKLSEELAPGEMVALLNEIFSAFDLLAEKYGMEKIKTIGDAYMAAGGLEYGGQHHYADRIADMALEMRELVTNYRPINEGRLEIRIGIGTGPVVAGVIGMKKFIYDLWGDTVNIASRMTSEGVAGGIQVDMTTYKRLYSRFRFDEPQTVQVKGKGLMQCYKLLGKREATEKQVVKSSN
ncbi:MAG: adenylate/guanylate cyclase domain-containing protein [Pseudomonadota bacterium]